MISVVIILLLWLIRKFLFDSELFENMLEYKFVNNDKKELNLLLSNKQTRFNIDQTLKDFLTFRLKGLIFRLQFHFIKMGYNQKKIFKLFSRRLLAVFKLLLATYIIVAYSLMPSEPYLGIKESNGSYYYFRTDCVTQDVSITGSRIKDCEDYIVGSPLSVQQIKQHSDKIENFNNYFNKFYFFLLPPLDLGAIFSGFYSLIVCILIFSFCVVEKKSFLIFDNHYILNKFLVSKNNRLFSDEDLISETNRRRYRLHSENALEFKVLMVRYLFNKLNNEEKYYFESLLKLGLGTWGFKEEGIVDKFDFIKYIYNYTNCIKNKVVKSKMRKQFESLFVEEVIFLLLFVVFYSFKNHGNPLVWGSGTMYCLISIYKN